MPSSPTNVALPIEPASAKICSALVVFVAVPSRMWWLLVSALADAVLKRLVSEKIGVVFSSLSLLCLQFFINFCLGEIRRLSSFKHALLLLLSPFSTKLATLFSGALRRFAGSG